MSSAIRCIPGARAPVLAVLRLQRLEQPARRRLGNDPARLRRRERARRADDGSNECRLQPARRRRTGGLELLEARTGGRHAPGRLPRGRFTRELLRRRALPRQLRESGCRLRRHGRAAPRSAPVGGDDPERPATGARAASLDCVRGALGRAAALFLQWPDRPQPEDPVDRADPMVGRLARPQLSRCLRPVCSVPRRRTSSVARSGAGRRPLSAS